MDIIFRCDSSIKIGGGHVMRCLTLADELRNQGGKAHFICRDFPGHISIAIQERGHKLSLLPFKNPKQCLDDRTQTGWLGVDWEQDADETIEDSNKIKANWIVIDHYGIDYRWHKKFRSCAEKIMVIDDLADRQLDCDLLLDQTFGRKKGAYRSLTPNHCHLLVGSDYTLLRPEFAQLRLQALEKRKHFSKIKCILVSMGAMDPENVTGGILGKLSKIEWESKPVVDVVLSKNAPHLSVLLKQAEEYPLKITIHTDVRNMGDFILKAELAIGSGGTTSWERCCLGLPTLVIENADNQKEIIKHLNRSKALINLGRFDQLNPLMLKKQIKSLQTSKSLYQEMVEAAKNVCDGRGTQRVLKKLYES